MTRPFDAEARKWMRYCAARVLRAVDCPCHGCVGAAKQCTAILETLAWVYGVELDRRHLPPYPLAEAMANVFDMEEIAKLTHDPRMKEILPG